MGVNEDIVSDFDQKHDESLDIRLEKIVNVDNCLLLKLTGYVDTYNTTLFQRRVNLAIESNFVRLIFDCTNLSYFSSTGIGSFTSFLKTVKPRGGDIVLFGMQQRLFEIFQLLGFSQFFSIKESKEEAINHFLHTHTEELSTVFPRIIQCPICSKRLRAMKSGRFRCSQCKSILAIDRQGNTSIG